MVLAGNDEAHPWPISEELSKLLPNCEFVAEWKTEPALTAARARVKEFLAKHTPRDNIRRRAAGWLPAGPRWTRHSTVTLFARLRGWSTSVPLITAT